MKSKKVIINNFRNIYMPTEENKESKEQNGNVLILSHNASEGSIVTLIGPNNAGKSNILDAINCDEKNYCDNIPDWEHLWNSSNHKVSVAIIDPSIQSHNLNIIESILKKWFANLKDIKDNLQILIDESKCEISYLLENKNFNADEFIKCFYESEENKRCILQLLFYLICLDGTANAKCVDLIRYIIEKSCLRHSYYTEFSKLYGKQLVTVLYESFKRDHPNILLNLKLNEIRDDIKSVLKFDCTNKISSDSLNFSLDSKTDFVKNLSSIIDEEDKNFDSIRHLIKSSKPESVVSADIDKIILNLNEQISKKITKRFNDLYFLKNEKYDFKIQRLGSYSNYSFGIILLKGNGDQIPLNLDKQSEGFKWFFNFYFSIIKDDVFNDKTIILLEEPAIHLHIEGQKQWLKFIREFAKKNKTTFVITTHSPFLVDCDYLDDIRVIYKDGEFTKINNYFSVNVNGDDQSSLQVLIDSFTLQNIISVLSTKEDKLILVEGITDYMYLNYFKSKNEKYKNLHFIPINGLGNTKNMSKVIERIIKGFGSSSFLLTDGDKIADIFEKTVNDKKTDLKIIKTTEVDVKFKTIESLISRDDISKYKYITEKRTSKIIGLCRSSDNVFDKETTNNFNKLLETIVSRL